MDVSNRATSTTEPLGIVISQGKRDETTPRFRAYVWGTAPDATIKKAQQTRP
jgi:hypothetical protein